MIPKIKTAPVEDIDWPFPVFVRRWSIAQRAAVFAAVRPAETPEQIARANVDIVLHSACDQSGTLLFSESDRSALEEDAFTVDAIAEAARALNIPEKKSRSTSSDDSSSGSPAISG